MANLSQINRKIKSTKSISKITNALKVVSSNQSYIYKELQKKSLPYLQGMYKIFFEVFQNPDHDIKTTNRHLISYEKNKYELWIALGTDIGMCGDFNDKLKKYMDSVFNKNEDGLVIVGNKLTSFFANEYKDVIELKRNSEVELSNLSKSIRKLTHQIFKLFINNHYQKLTLVYLKDPKAGMIEKINILPFTEEYFSSRKRVFVKSLNADLSYPEAIIDLFPQYLECIFLSAIMNSKIGEHNIRRELMHNATKNANDLLEEYTLSFNKLRQATITQEITEIMVAVQAKKK